MKYQYTNSSSFFKNEAVNKEKQFYSFKLLNCALLCLAGFVSIFFVPNYSFAQQNAAINFAKNNSNAQDISKNCNCSDDVSPNKKGTDFYQKVSSLTNYTDLQEAMGGLLVGGEKTFNALYFKNLMADEGSFYSHQFDMSVVALHSFVKITSSDNTYTLNLTPCENETHNFMLPFSLSSSYDILKYDPRFNNKDFDHTGQAYLRIIFLILKLHPDTVLKGLLTEMIDSDSPKSLRFNRFIQTCNKAYNTAVPLASFNKAKYKTCIPLLLKQLKAKYINPEEVINDEFILTDPSTHVMNAEEKKNLSEIIFEFYGGGFNLDNFDNQMLKPRYFASVGVKFMGIEISDKIIRSWDIENKRPILDSNKKPIPSKILATIPNLEFSSDHGMDAKIKSICLSTSEISGTGIMLNFDHAVLVDKNIEDERSFSKYNYPLFRIMPKKGEKDKVVDGMTIANYDTLITKFSGLLIDEATISIPFKGRTISTSLQNLIINNKLISGQIRLELDQPQSTSNDNITLKMGNGSTMVVNVKDLQQALNGKGIKDLQLKRGNNYLIIFFKKTYRG